MKKSLLLFLLCVTCLTGIAQTIQPCVVQQYNREHPKTPLGGVEITVSNAGSAVSDMSGNLELVFRTLKPGDKVHFVSADKIGYEVFNTSDIDQWNISRDGTPYHIVMVKKDLMAKYKERLTLVSTNSYKEKYHQAVKMVDELKRKGKIKEADYNAKLDELEKQYQDNLKNLNNYIDQFAHIDLSEVTEEEKQILDMVENGFLDAAVQAYESLDIAGKLRQARQGRKILTDAKNQIEAEENRQAQIIEDLKAKQKREIATLKMAGGKENFERIASLLRENAMADTTNYADALDYALFSCDQRNYREAEEFALRCLSILESDDSPFPLGSLDQLEEIANTQADLAAIYGSSMNHALANEYSQKSLNGFQQLYDRFPETYRLVLAKTQGTFGAIAIQSKDYALGEKLLKESLANYDTIDEEGKASHLEEISRILSYLGGLYLTTKDYPKSESNMLNALEMVEQLSQENETDCLELKADIQINLGTLYIEIKHYNQAVEYLNSALNNYEALFQKNPDAFREPMANAQNNLGYLYMNIGQRDKAEEYLLQSVRNRELLFTLNPEAYRSNLAMSQGNLGALYLIEGRFLDAERFLLLAEGNLQFLFRYYPGIYQSNLSANQYNLASLYSALNQWGKAEDCALMALSLREELFMRRPDTNRPEYSKALCIVGDIYRQKRDLTKAQEYYEKALEQLSLLYSHDPDIYREDLASVQRDLGMSLCQAQKYEKVEDLLRESANNLYELYSQSPDVYSSQLAETYKSLGFFYWQTQRLEECENNYLKAYEILLSLSRDDPEEYLYPMADLQYMLGATYERRYAHDKEEYFYALALDNYNKLFLKSADAYRPGLAKTQCNMGEMYVKRKDFSQAEGLIKEAYNNYCILFNQYPEQYRADIAKAQGLLGIIFMNTGRMDQAQDYLTESIKNEFLIPENNQASIDNLLLTLSNLGVLYHLKGDAVKAEEYLLDALHRLINSSDRQDRDKKEVLAHVQNNLIALYLQRDDTDKAMALLLEAIPVYSELSQYDSEKYMPELTYMQSSLGCIYLNNNQFDKAAEILSDACDNAKQLVLEDADTYRPVFAEALGFLGSAQIGLEKTSNARECYSQSLNIWQILYRDNPDLFIKELALAQNDYGISLIYSGDYVEGEKYLLSAYDTMTKIFSDGGIGEDEMLLTERTLGLLFYEKGDYENAGLFFRKALEHCKVLIDSGKDSLIVDYADYQYQLVDIYGHGGVTYGQYESMIDDALKTHEIVYIQLGEKKEQFLDLLLRKGDRLLKKGKYSEALTFQERAYQINPDNLVGERLASGCYETAVYLFREGIFPQALNCINRAISLIPEESTFYLTKGEILLELGETKGALEMWNTIIRLDPTCLDGWGKTSVLYKKLTSKGLLNE